MTDHRRLQRTLFRMQLDPAFARRVFAREPQALASSGLAPADLALLFAADPRAVGADPGERRRMQVLGNAASEFPATLAAAALGSSAPELLVRFVGADELHRALAQDGALPLAFGAYAARVARDAADPLLAALVTLELALARLRRRAPGDPRVAEPLPAAGSLALSRRAQVLSLPAGTHAAASALRVALAQDERAARPRLCAGTERLLLLAAPRPSPLRLAEVTAEPLEPPADALLERLAEGPLDESARERFAGEHGARLAELDAFLEGFVREGALVRGPASRLAGGGD